MFAARRMARRAGPGQAADEAQAPDRVERPPGAPPAAWAAGGADSASVA